MVEDKLNKKYYVWIWLGLILSSAVRNVYQMYASITLISGISNASLALNILRIVTVQTATPVVICLLASLVIYYIGFSRYVRCISRRDFCYWIMIFVSVANMLMGVIEAFAILDESVAIFCGSLFDVTVMFGAMMLLYFWIFVRKYNLNPVERERTFKFWVMPYTVVLFVYTVFGHGSVMFAYMEGMIPEIQEMLAEYGYDYVFSAEQIYASVTALVFALIDLVVMLVIMGYNKKLADTYRDPDTREDYMRAHERKAYNVRDDVTNTFGDDFDYNNSDDNPYSGESKGKSGKDNVFDEFDL